MDAIKPADTAENAILVRVYESMGSATDAVLRVPETIQRISEVDMLEENGRAYPTGPQLEARFGAFEIKTFLLYL